MAENTYFNIDAERELLSRIMLENSILIHLDDLSTNDFYDPKHQAIYSTMTKLMKAEKAISAISLHDQLKTQDFPLSLFTELSGIAASTSDFKTYSQIVKEHSKKRQLIKLLRDTAKELETNEHDEVLHKLNTDLFRASQHKSTNNIVSDSQAMERALQAIENNMKQGQSSGMKTGLHSIDKALKGLNRGDLVIIAARPSMGKSMFALKLTEGLGASGHKVGFFELDSTLEKISFRRLAALCTIPLNKMHTPSNLSEAELQVLMRVTNMLQKRDNIFVDDTAGISLDDLRNKVHYLKMTKGLDCIFVDHLGLMKMNSKVSRNEAISEITAGLRVIAKQFNICVVALSQLSRAPELRADHRPILSDLRDSGSIEQDADQVIFLYREGYYRDKDEEIPDQEKLEVIIAKNRDGATGTKILNVRLAYQQVSEYLGGK